MIKKTRVELESKAQMPTDILPENVDDREKSPITASPSPVPVAATPVVRTTTQVTDDAPFQQLDPSTIALWRCINAITMSVISVVAITAGAALFWVVPFPVHLVIVSVWLGLAGLGAISVVWWPRWEYRHWSYRVNEKVVELRHGVLWRVSVQIPLTRLQHVDLHRGPMESRWGLASLEVHTAGTRNASHRISGLDTVVANELRDRLVDAANRRPNETAKR